MYCIFPWWVESREIKRHRSKQGWTIWKEGGDQQDQGIKIGGV